MQGTCDDRIWLFQPWNFNVRDSLNGLRCLQIIQIGSNEVFDRGKQPSLSLFRGLVFHCVAQNFVVVDQGLTGSERCCSIIGEDHWRAGRCQCNRRSAARSVSRCGHELSKVTAVKSFWRSSLSALDSHVFSPSYEECPPAFVLGVNQ